MQKDSKTEDWNEYFYSNTNVFINKLGIKDEEQLYKIETELSFNRLVQLNENPVNGSFDKSHLCYIHWYLFQDLYDWAGRFRKVNIAKNHSNFTDYKDVSTYLDYELKLMNEDFKTIINKDMLASFLAEYYVILLDIHPFREGNGRAIREFLREFVLVKCKEYGLGSYELDWSKVNGDIINEAIVNSKMFRSPIEMELNKALINNNEIERHLC